MKMPSEEDVARDLATSLALCDAATPPPWSWEDDPPTLYSGRTEMMHGLNLLGRLGPDRNGKANLDFICAARDGWPRTLSELAEARRQLAALKASPPLDRVTFDALVRWWHADMAFVSSATKITAHPAYRRIVAAGKGVVPLIIAELRKGPDHWSCALREITGEDPIDPADHGNMEAMRRAWLAWAERVAG